MSQYRGSLQIEIIKPYLEKCRAGDWNHSLRVVSWVKELGNGRKDIDLLIIAAYIHDIGWFGVMQKGVIDFDEMLKFEAKANKNTPKYVKQVSKKLVLNKENISTIIRLIKAADRHLSEKEDEEIIVDADNLSKLCVEHLKEKYKPESYVKVIASWEREFSTRIKTEMGKVKYPVLLNKLRKDLGLV